MRTSALRLSVVYAASFAAALVALVFVIYLLTTRFINTEVDAVIERDALGLLEAYGRSGTPGIISELNLRASTFSRINAVYLLTDGEGFVIAGNLPAWPMMRGRDGRWAEFEIELREGGIETDRPVRALVLDPAPGVRLLVGTDLSDRRDLGRRFAVAAAIGTLLVTLLALGIGYRQSQRILARVEAVSRSCKEIVSGNLARRLPLAGDDDEFDTLAVEVNALLARLARTTEILRTALHSAAHDLRSPMHRMRLRLEQSLSASDAGATADQTRPETLEQTLRDVDHMQRVLTALLQIAEAESGTVGALPEPVALDTMLGELGELYQPQAEEQGVELSVACATGSSVLGHRQLLAQAVANLIDNALKFTPAGGRIELRTRVAEGRLIISVTDSGPGIPADERARAVEPFVRLSNAPPRDGSGLGLNLAAAVARLHGGSLRLEDNRPGLVALLEVPAGVPVS
ncbi:MAG: HAMP domain-containing histidine kinase [Gammaproteobacteria bacterium]|nr:HAMP domain-containing histidine kinase [Gammaproteobacteria bacterium]